MLILSRHRRLMPLTDTQFAMLMDVYRGFSYKEIAERQGVSRSGIKWRMNEIYQRLEAERLIDRTSRDRKTVACVWLHRFLTSRGDWCVPALRSEGV